MATDHEGYRRLRELFHEAVELRAALREARVAGLARSDAEMVAELKSLLDAH